MTSPGSTRRTGGVIACFQVMSRSSPVVAVALAVFVAPVGANTYAVPDDFGVAALELATGNVVWRTPGKLHPATLRVEGGAVVASEDPDYLSPGAKARSLVLDVATGAKIKRPRGAKTIAPLAELPRNLAHAGRTLAYGSGGTGYLAYEADATHGIDELVQFDWSASDVHVVRNRAIVTFNFESGGEVYAYDLDTKQFAWDFRTYEHVPSIPEHVHTSISVDRDRVLVSADEHVFAVDAATGALVWHTALPRQPIRRYDAAWTTFARHGDTLILRVYEDLFALSAADGKLRWRFDAGVLARPWPVIAGDKLFVAWRGQTANAQSASFGGQRTVRPTSVRLHKTARGWQMTAQSARKAPAGTTRWSTLRLPPSGGRGPKIELTLAGGYQPKFDLTAVAAKGEVWVEFKGYHDSATLTVGGKPVATVPLK